MTSASIDGFADIPKDLNEEDQSVEAEIVESPDPQITEPFDPEDIKIRTRPLLVGQLVRRVEDGSLDLSPEFQRLRGIWDSRRKSRLIESLLLRIPIPVFYVAANTQDEWQVVDGLQRMSTIHDFVKGDFALARLEYLAQFNGKHHEGLPRLMQRRIDETELIINVIEPPTPPAVMFNVFVRINTLGMTLNSQELRHAAYPGPVRGLLKELAECGEFLQATDNSISPRRMADKECILRFIAFYLNDPSEYNSHDLDTFLSTVMAAVNNMTVEERHTLDYEFRRAMTAAHLIFGNEAFRKNHSDGASRNPINRSLFEAWSVTLAKLSSDDEDVLLSQPEAVRQKSFRLMNDEEFNNAVSYGTGTRQHVRKRFQAVAELIQEFI